MACCDLEDHIKESKRLKKLKRLVDILIVFFVIGCAAFWIFMWPLIVKASHAL